MPEANPASRASCEGEKVDKEAQFRPEMENLFPLNWLGEDVI